MLHNLNKKIGLIKTMKPKLQKGEYNYKLKKSFKCKKCKLNTNKND